MSRVNVLYSTYTKIAIDNYFLAKDLLAEIEKQNDLEFCSNNFDKVEQSIIVACVFSIMAIESFFNDYAAKKLGDEEFYDNFDKLSLLSKFQLISKFILNVEIDKSKAYYSNLKSTERNRNSFVHNKSQDYFAWSKNNKEVHQIEEADLDNVDVWLRIEIETLKSDFKIAKRAINAIRDIALFFDKADKKSYATLHLFSSFFSLGYNNRNEVVNIMQEEIKKEFNI